MGFLRLSQLLLLLSGDVELNPGKMLFLAVLIKDHTIRNFFFVPIVFIKVFSSIIDIDEAL